MKKGIILFRLMVALHYFAHIACPEPITGKVVLIPAQIQTNGF